MPRRSVRSRRAVFAAGWLACVAGAIGWSASGCNGWDPRDPFEHHSPVVDEAIQSLDAGQYRSAEQVLEEYLETGACGDAGIGLPEEVRKKPDGSFDLGLTLFHLAEKYGKRFGDEESDASTPEPPPPARAVEVGCAMTIVKAIADDVRVAPELRARAYYLAGNLQFMSRAYRDAVKLYDGALAIVPAVAADGGDAGHAGRDDVGADAAHNRAIALRRLEEENDGGPDAGQDGSDDNDGGDGGDGGDAGNDGSDGGKDGGADGGDGGGDDPDEESAGPDAGDGGKDAGADAGQDAGRDAGNDQQDQADASTPASPQPQPQTPQTQEGSQDDRMLDRLEEAPSYQQQEARVKGNRRRGRSSMEDK